VEKQRDVADGIRKGDASQIEVTIHEPVAHDLLENSLRPVFEPLLEGKTPDLSFETAGMKCIADIVICHSCSGLRTVSDGLANNVISEPTIRESMRGLKPTLAENERRFIATSSQTARWTNIQCIQSREGLTVR
jgi:hypothetical protein